MAGKDQYSTNLGLSVLPEINQTEQPQIYAELLRIRNALKILQGTLDYYTGALHEDKNYWNQTSYLNSTRIQNIARIYVKAGEDLINGELVNLIDSSGLVAYKTDASVLNKPAKAFCNGDVLAGQFGEFVLFGINPFFTGLIPGTIYYLSSTPGTVINIPPTTPGTLVQQVGFALDSTKLFFNPAGLYWEN